MFLQRASASVCERLGLSVNCRLEKHLSNVHLDTDLHGVGGQDQSHIELKNSPTQSTQSWQSPSVPANWRNSGRKEKKNCKEGRQKEKNIYTKPKNSLDI